MCCVCSTGTSGKQPLRSRQCRPTQRQLFIDHLVSLVVDDDPTTEHLEAEVNPLSVGPHEHKLSCLGIREFFIFLGSTHTVKFLADKQTTAPCILTSIAHFSLNSIPYVNGRSLSPTTVPCVKTDSNTAPGSFLWQCNRIRQVIPNA